MDTLIRFVLIFFASGSLFATKAPEIKIGYPPDQIAENVYVIHGPITMPSAANQGFMNNPVFIITSKGVVLVDPGSSVQSGEMVLSEIKKLTDKPVIAVFNSHIHGDHWLGNQAIVEAFPEVNIYAHPNMIQDLVEGEGHVWTDLMLELTEGATEGTKVVAPNKPIEHGQVLTFGETVIEVLNYGTAHTDGDIILFLPKQGVVILGDVACRGRIPRMGDGSILGNVQAINKTLDLSAKVFVPGHGQTGGTIAATSYRDYLQSVYDGVTKYYGDGLSDFEIKPLLLPDMKRWIEWIRFEIEFGKHISYAYQEVEEADF